MRNHGKAKNVEDAESHLQVEKLDEWVHILTDEISYVGGDGSKGLAASSTFFKVLPHMEFAIKLASKPTLHIRSRAYMPIIFTFGPYHARLRVPLSAEDKFKVQAAMALTSPEEFTELVADIQAQYDADVRKLYYERWDQAQRLRQPHTLAVLLALDSLTLIAGACDPTTQKHSAWMVLIRDACLLEQQLPLFLLEAALDKCSGIETVDVKDVVEFYALKWAASFFQQDPPSAICWSWQRNESMLGIVHRTIFMSCEKDDVDNHEQQAGCATITSQKTKKKKETVQDLEAQHNDRDMEPTKQPEITFQKKTKKKKNSQAISAHKNNRIASASKLRKCGIKFAAGNGNGFTRISFDARSRTLTLPMLTVFDDTQTYLLNLLAYEACLSPSCSNVVTSYAAFMDYLVDVPEDVKVLVDYGIINNQLGSDAALASMFNHMMVYVTPSMTTHHKQVIFDVNKACKNQWQTVLSNFKETYFKNKPWLLISVIAASFLFILTLLQTIYTIN